MAPRRASLLLLAALAAVLPAAAQPPRPLKRPEVHGFSASPRVGRRRLHRHRPSAGFGIGTRLTRRLGVEGEYTFFARRPPRLRLRRLCRNAHLFTGNAPAPLPQPRRRAALPVDRAGGQSYEGSGPGFTWNCGAGLKAFLNDHLFLRPESASAPENTTC
ncbi:MAG: hypothetical protein IPJ98_28730 [Bryobacterales bacterium]|nr:hypothetical protein [Bryobacterales bacterium]